MCANLVGSSWHFILWSRVLNCERVDRVLTFPGHYPALEGTYKKYIVAGVG